MARAGDEVLVYPGIYREYVDPVNAGTKDERIVYHSVEPLGATISGAEEAKGWKPYEKTTYMFEVDNGVFNGYNPYALAVEGDWYFTPKNAETGEFIDMHRGAVYINDRQMYEAVSLEDCVEGKPFERSWEKNKPNHKTKPHHPDKTTTN